MARIPPKSNRWDFTADLLWDDYIMYELKVCERAKMEILVSSFSDLHFEVKGCKTC